MFQYPKSFFLVMLLMVTCNVRAEFAPFSYMTSILSRVVYCCKPQTWGKFLWNRYGWTTRQELKEQLFAAKQEIKIILDNNKQEFDTELDRVQSELMKKLKESSEDSSRQLQNVQTSAKKDFDMVQAAIGKLYTLAQDQQKLLEAQIVSKIEQSDKNWQQSKLEFKNEIDAFKQTNSLSNQKFHIKIGDLQKNIISLDRTREKNLEIVEGIQRPLKEDQYIMFEQALSQFEKPFQVTPKKIMGAAAALQLALPSNHH